MSDAELYLFIQRVIISTLLLSVGLVFGKNAWDNYKTDDVASLKQEIARLLGEVNTLTCTLDGFQDIRNEMIRFSVEVWQSDIEELQMNMRTVFNKSAVLKDDFEALCGQVAAQSQEMALMKRVNMEEVSNLRNQLEMQATAHKKEMAKIKRDLDKKSCELMELHATISKNSADISDQCSDFKALVWTLQWEGRLGTCGTIHTSRNISEKRGWNHGDAPPPPGTGK